MLIFQVMLATTQFMMQMTKLMRSYFPCKNLLKNFLNASLVISEDKCHLIVSTDELTEIQIGDLSIKRSGSEKLLGVNIDSKLDFDCHVNHLCSKANKKLRVLARVTPYMT